MTASILIADDEAPQRKVLGGYLRKHGHTVHEAATGDAAIRELQGTSIDLVISDYRMPGGTGLDVLRSLRESHPGTPLILVTAFGSIEGAVEAMREGAFDYISKPVNLEKLSETIERALRSRPPAGQTSSLDDLPDPLSDFATQSDAMRHTLRAAGRAALSDATVLVLGETGVGKEVIARAIHAASSRQKGPFVAINSAALAEGVLESELFGHEKGAFTGASGTRQGRFEEANHGTIFLDELGDIAQAVQVRLLRVLQEGEFQRVGGSATLRTDARVIGATHRDLETLVQEGQFREDLYYRLNVVSLTIPPLRDRSADIPSLAGQFLETYAERNGKSIAAIQPEAMDLLVHHTFPGNVRELENAIERAVVMAQGDVIRPEDLPAIFLSTVARRSDADGSLPEQLDRVEREAIVDAMHRAGGVQSKAAALLGINERNLRYKLKKHGLK